MRDRQLEKRHVLYVKMFGDFSIVYQGVSLIGKKKKETQFAQVLQLLLHDRQDGISRECLETVLFGERKLDDAKHAIHSLLYNTRKKLERAGLPKGKYIISKKGRFYWDSEIPFEEDAQVFEECCRKAYETEKREEQMELLWKAILLYRGAFLENSEQSGWVCEERERYSAMFRKLVEDMADVLREKKAYMQLEELGRHAVRVSPYEERELLVIEALTGMGRSEQAQILYGETIEKYRKIYTEDQLGKLKDFQRKIISFKIKCDKRY